MAKHKKKKKKKNRSGPTIADRADKHVLYEKAVQSPDADIEFFEKVYRDTRGAEPLRFREDFCGTASLSTQWIASGPERRAYGVDLCAETLDWGRERNLEKNPEVDPSRIELVQGNVLDGLMPRDGIGADIGCAMNFSFCVFKTRSDLLAYLKKAYETLAPGGLFFMEMYGGPEARTELEDEREVENFIYVWDQDSYNPINHHTRCYIHFRFPDGSVLERAFTYEWRVWSLPELQELLVEAGFVNPRVFWETVDDDPDDPDVLTGTGEYEEVQEVENQDSWLVYVVGERAEAAQNAPV
jgi:SAM-dependent methyltransferase